MGEGKGRPCARGTSPSPHFGSFHSFLIGGLVRDTHERLLLLPNMSCVCSTNRTALCRNSIIPPLHWIWITPAVFPCIGSLGVIWVGQQVWFGSLPSPPQQILPLFFAQRLQRQFAPSRKLESLMPACLPVTTRGDKSKACGHTPCEVQTNLDPFLCNPIQQAP